MLKICSNLKVYIQLLRFMGERNMTSEPKKVDRRKFLYAGVGAAIVVLGGATLYLATKPAETITSVSTSTATTTATTTVPTTSVVTTTQTTAAKEINVWWYISWLPGEKSVTIETALNFEHDTGVKVNLTFFPQADLNTKVRAAVEAKAVPDVVADTYWFNPLIYAYRGVLEDLSDIVLDPAQKNDWQPGVLDGAYWLDATTGKRGYFILPMMMDGNYFHFWKDLYAKAGYATTPTDWDGFWKSIKDAHNANIKDGIYGIGMPVGDTSPSDVMSIFEQILRLQGVDMLTEDLKLNTSDEAKKGIESALNFYVGLYKEGLTPKGAISWDDGGNNNAFHTRSVVATSNNTMSIPAYQYTESKDNYYNKMFTALWPKGPTGDDRMDINVRGIYIFRDAKNKELGKEFVKYFTKRDVYTNWIVGNEGRFCPVYKSVADNTQFFKQRDKDRVDPNIPVQIEMIKNRKTVVANMGRHAAYAQVAGIENIWPKLMVKMINEGLSAKDAAQQAVARLQQAFQEFK
jgi:multiple sugar transport system substrate-binding protein